MRILIDTHTFIWFTSGDKKLSNKGIKIINDINNEVLISIVSLWEIAIKSSLGKLKINGRFEDTELYLASNNINILPITLNHLIQVNNLPFENRDPFDRMICAQAICEKMNLISIDTVFDKYFQSQSIKRIWE